MKLVVLGSGTVALHPERVCAGYYVEAGPHRILLDCGPGTPHQLARLRLRWDRITHIALSHFHTDHVAGLPLLIFAMRHGVPEPRSERLDLAGPEGASALIERLADAFGDYLRDPGFPLSITELAHGETWPLATGIHLLAHRTPHTDASLAYRLETPDGAIGYTGDTGNSEELGAFFDGVDILIAECSLPDEAALENHLTPSRVAALARRAAPGLLLVTHMYPQLEAQDVPALIRAAGWDGGFDVAHDGMRIDVARQLDRPG
ncbi:MAG: MBL fold metallo-hydrolase [Longimicrobiales bacterium]